MPKSLVFPWNWLNSWKVLSKLDLQYGKHKSYRFLLFKNNKAKHTNLKLLKMLLALNLK